jgi:aminomethyltransferase
MFSTILKKHIAMAKVEPAMAALGTEVLVELIINNRPRAVKAKVVKMPFFNPARKTEHI